MNRRLSLSIGGLAAVIAGVWLARAPGANEPSAAATNAGSSSSAGAVAALRTPWGEPDLQGIWSGGYILTPLERPDRFAEKEFLTDEDVAVLEHEAALTFGVGAGAGRLPRPPRGTEADVGGAYNDVFAGRGTKVVRSLDDRASSDAGR